jgi:TfoX/Sxy family transcriptional regulator of competence genes
MSSGPWRKPQPDQVERFTEAVAGIEGVELRKMFGFPAAFIAGNMTAGLHQESVMIRLSAVEREERLAAGWSLFEPMPGKPMREYVALPAQVAADVDEMRAWIERAAAYVRTMPPKAPKPPKERKSPNPRRATG